jgi:antitoxin FitA
LTSALKQLDSDAILTVSGDRMAQILVRRIDRELMERLHRRAEKHGHSMEEEVRHILRDALRDDGKPEKGLGTRIAERFRGIGLKEDIPELRVEPRIPKFG